MTSTILRLALAVSAAMLPHAASAKHLCTVTKYGGSSTITTGVVYQPYTVSCPDSVEGGPSVPPKSGNMHLVTVTLTTPGLSLQASAPSAASDPSIPGTGAIFTVAPTSAVFSSSGRKASSGAPVPQLAINANLFTICCTTAVPPPSDDAKTRLRGMEIAQGTRFVSPLANRDISDKIPYATFATSLVINRRNHASFWTAGPSTLFPGAVLTAVTGSHQIVRYRKITVPACSTLYPCTKKHWLGPNARTGVGLNGPSSLVMIVADGVDNASGLSLYQFADVFSQVAETAINLDGGGSSTMVRRGGANGYTILNTLNGSERDVGATLYVVAR